MLYAPSGYCELMKKPTNTHTISGINLCITHNVTPNDLLFYQLFFCYFMLCRLSTKMLHKLYVGLSLFYFHNVPHKVVLNFSTICKALFFSLKYVMLVKVKYLHSTLNNTMLGERTFVLQNKEIYKFMNFISNIK